MADRMKKMVQTQFDEVLTPKGHTLEFIGKTLSFFREPFYIMICQHYILL